MHWLRLKQVMQVVPVSKSTIWQWVKDGKFPAPTHLSKRCTVWNSEDVQKFMADASK